MCMNMKIEIFVFVFVCILYLKCVFEITWDRQNCIHDKQYGEIKCFILT